MPSRPPCEGVAQRLQPIAIFFGDADRAVEHPLAHLRPARRVYRPWRMREVEAARIPLESAMRDEAPRLLFLLEDERLVVDVVDEARQYLAPVHHQVLIEPVVVADLGKVVC